MPESRPIAYEPLEPSRRLLVLAFLVTGLWYFTWRLGSFNPQARLFSWLVYGAEVFGFLTAMLHIFMCWRLTCRTSPPVRAGLTVDVLIPSYNESADLVRHTLLAALAMEYPHRTWLLDDGRRSEMKALAEELGCGYITRADNAHAKAGNLNHALARTSGELVAVFDADHAPRRDFLIKTLGYFEDPAVAFVQTPQDFYNLDSYQHRRAKSSGLVWTEQSLFFRVIQRGKDYWQSAFFCGSCAVVRRKALDAIGGFATGTVTEDLHTSIRLHAKGYKSVYHAEPLAFGVAPESIEPFLGQRIRWGQGAMHVWRKEGVLSHSGLTWAQRLNYFASILTYFDGWQKGLFYIAPVLVLLTGTMPLHASATSFLLHFIPYYILTFWVFEEVGRGYGHSVFVEQYNMARFAAFAWATLAWLFPIEKFRVTVKGGNRRRRALRFTFPQWLILAGNFLAIPLGLMLYLYASSHELPLDGLIANVVWAAVNGSLALAVLLFTAASEKNARADYRFPIPVVAEVLFPDGSRSRGTVHNISVQGFRFVGRMPAKLTKDSGIVAVLMLPTGPVMIKGRLRNLMPPEASSAQPQGFGCIFTADKEDQRRLERFLFGSDLQWTINGYTDQAPTPLTWLRRAHAQAPRHHPLAQIAWHAAAIQASKAAASQPVLACAEKEGKSLVLSFLPLPEKRPLRLSVYLPSSTPSRQIRLERTALPGAESASLFLYRYAPTPDATSGP